MQWGFTASTCGRIVCNKVRFVLAARKVEKQRGSAGISSGFKETAPTVNEAWNEPTVSDGLNVYCNYTEAEKSNSFIYFICLFFRAQTSHCPQIAPVVSDCMRMSISQSCHVTDLSERTCWCLGDTSMLQWSRRPTANVPFNLNMNH